LLQEEAKGITALWGSAVPSLIVDRRISASLHSSRKSLIGEKYVLQVPLMSDVPHTHADRGRSKPREIQSGSYFTFDAA